MSKMSRPVEENSVNYFERSGFLYLSVVQNTKDIPFYASE